MAAIMVIVAIVVITVVIVVVVMIVMVDGLVYVDRLLDVYGFFDVNWNLVYMVWYMDNVVFAINRKQWLTLDKINDYKFTTPSRFINSSYPGV